MKATLFAAVLLAAFAGAAFAGEGNGDPFAQHLVGGLGTYAVGPTAALSQGRPVAQLLPGYARLLPADSNMALVQPPNSLPQGSVGAGVAHGRRG